jgi:hypothetical protein
MLNTYVNLIRLTFKLRYRRKTGGDQYRRRQEKNPKKEGRAKDEIESEKGQFQSGCAQTRDFQLPVSLRISTTIVEPTIATSSPVSMQ